MKRRGSEQIVQYAGLEADVRRRRSATGLLHRRLTLVGVFAGFAVLACATNSWALSGTPINIGPAGQAENAPAVAVSANGTAYIAWPNSNDATDENETIQYCTLPAGASKCEYSQTLTPVTLSDFSSSVYGPTVQVLLDGTTVVLLADTGEQNGDYGPVQEWTSTDGGATFNVVNLGRSVAFDSYGHKNPETEGGITDLDSAVVVPGGSLGVGWTDASGIIGETPGLPEFSEFPFASPPECSVESCPTPVEAQSLQPSSTYPPAGDTLPAVFASQSVTAGNVSPGVLGLFSTSPLEANATCPGSGPTANGTAFVYGSGAQSPTNSYAVTPGLTNSAWKVAYSPADCGDELPAVGGGPSGFGVVEDGATTTSIIYHPFDQQSMSFDTPKTTITSTEAGLFSSVSQDGTGGIYTTYEGLSSTGTAEGVRLAYSANGGQSWTGPATLYSNPEEGGLVSSVGSDGQGWASWHQEGSIYAQQFDSSDATPSSTTPATTSNSTTPSGTTSSSPAPPIPAPPSNGTVSYTATIDANGTTVTLTFALTCKSTSPCVITITLTSSEGSGSLSFAASAKHKTTKHHAKTVTVATGTLTLAAGATSKLSLHLTKTGKKLLAAKHGHLTTKLEIKDTSAGHTTSSTRSLTINTKSTKKKSKH